MRTSDLAELVRIPGGTPYNGLYVEAPSERGTFSGSRVGISQVVIEVVELTNKIQKYIN